MRFELSASVRAPSGCASARASNPYFLRSCQRGSSGYALPRHRRTFGRVALASKLVIGLLTGLVLMAASEPGRALGAISFQEVPESPYIVRTDGGAVGLVAGRLDADTAIDLGVSEQTSGLFSLLRGDGDATFTPFGSPVSVSPGPRSIAAADLDGDLDPDVVTHSAGLADVLRNNGDGSFTRITPALAVGGSGSRGPVAIADVVGDGHPDIIVGTGHEIVMRPGDGALGFGTATTITVSGDVIRGLAAADFNGDGFADLATAQALPAVAVRLRIPGGGFGAGQSAAVYPPTQDGGDLNALVAEPIDAGPTRDVAVFDAQLDRVVVLAGNGAGGLASGQSSPAATGGEGPDATADQPSGLAVTDLDGDGDTDAVAGTSGADATTVLPGSGASVFGTPQVLAVGGATAIVAADFDGDLRPDLATGAGGQVRAFRNTTPFRPLVSTVSLEDITFHSVRASVFVTAMDSPATVQFELGTDGAVFDTVVAAGTLPAGAGAEAVTATLEGLASNTKYHLRARATNTAGSVVSDAVTFTTTGDIPDFTVDFAIERGRTVLAGAPTTFVVKPISVPAELQPVTYRWDFGKGRDWSRTLLANPGAAPFETEIETKALNATTVFEAKAGQPSVASGGPLVQQPVDKALQRATYLARLQATDRLGRVKTVAHTLAVVPDTAPVADFSVGYEGRALDETIAPSVLPPTLAGRFVPRSLTTRTQRI